MNDIATPEFENRKKRRTRLIAILLSLLGLLVLLPLAWFAYLTAGYYTKIRTGEIIDPNTRRLQASISSYVANTRVTQADLQRLQPTGIVPELGNRNAKVAVLEFVDYQCPFSKQQAPIIRRVVQEMGDRIHFYVRDFPITELHPDARNASLAAGCILAQSQDMYWRFYDLVFNDQEHMSPDDLRTLASFVNADMKVYDTCVQNRTYDRKIDQDIDAAHGAGVQGTPTFFVNGVKFQGLMDEKTLTEILNQFLEAQPK